MSITSGYLHVAVDDGTGVGNLFRFAKSLAGMDRFPQLNSIASDYLHRKLTVENAEPAMLFRA